VNQAQGERRAGRGWAACVGAAALGLLGGCTSSFKELADVDLSKPRVELPSPQKEAVYRAGHWEQEASLQPGTLAGDLASAKILFERAQYSDAESVFHWLAGRAEKEKSQAAYEEALYYEAECLYAQGQYPKARDTYFKLLKEFPSSRFRAEAVRRQFDIADYWLKDTRDEMAQAKEVTEGKRWFVTPTLVHWEKEKPTFGQEDYAVKACESIYVQDPAGPLAPEALYRAGGVNFYRERYKDADDFYSLLVDQYPKSRLAPQALELALQAKTHVTGGPDYDSRKLAEARTLADRALRAYPEIRDNPEKRKAIEQTVLGITNQQAEKDFNVAEFYRRTGHPGPAYFQYELVRRRYAGSEWANRATERLLELRAEVEKEAAHK
jgi:outer membrane protein assembly factor BamD (BamD/ComL family)